MCQAGDKISSVGGELVSNFDCSRHAANLPDARPVIVTCKPRTCFKGAILDATMALANGRVAVKLLFAQSLGAGGKSLAESQLQ